MLPSLERQTMKAMKAMKPTTAKKKTKSVTREKKGNRHAVQVLNIKYRGREKQKASAPEKKNGERVKIWNTLVFVNLPCGE